MQQLQVGLKCNFILTHNTYRFDCDGLFKTRVIDLGVMTPCNKIIKTALDEKAGTLHLCLPL